MAIKHYNTFTLSREDMEEIEKDYPEMLLFYHDFYGEEMADAYEPFLSLIKTLYMQEAKQDIDEFLEECQVYSRQRSLIRAYIQNGECRRQEEVILSEVAYEKQRMTDSLIRIMIHCAGKHPFLLVLNGCHLAGKSTIMLLDKLFDYPGNENICVLSAYNNLHGVLPHIADDWSSYTEKLEESGCVIDGEMMADQGQSEEQNARFHFNSANVKRYLMKLNNMYQTLDLEQAKYYLGIIYRKIELERLLLQEQDKFEILELYARVCILSDDIATALLVCENLQTVQWEKGQFEGRYLYYYLLGVTQMYNGSLKEAIHCAGRCMETARSVENDFYEFKAKLLEVMARMSGWHNILFCANDVEVEEEFICKAEEYGYINHLAYTYIFAYDNSRELFNGLTGIEDRLLHYKKGIALAKEMDNQFLLVEAYRKNIMIASVYGLFDISDYYYYKWKEVIKDSDPFAMANIYNGLGYNSCATERYEKANECYNRALLLFYQLGRVDYMGETFYNMAINCMLAEDFKSAYTYLCACLKIVRKMKLNDLRICNISKLFGLLALCSCRLNMIYNAKVYLKSNKQFLSHILERDQSDTKDRIDPSFTLCDDDIFLSYYVEGLICVEEGKYEEALACYDRAEIYIERSTGFQFFSFVQYHVERAKLYEKMGREEKKKEELYTALNYAREHENMQRAMQLQNLLDQRNYNPQSCDLKLQKITMEEINQVIRQAGILRDYEDLQKQMEFLTIWQKIIAIDGKDKNMLVDNAMNVFTINANLDGIIFIKYYEDVPCILYENTPIPLKEEMVPVLEAYFKKHRAGFVTSKLQANYNEYHTVISLFGANRVCSMLCIPFYVNEKLDSIFVTYILMKDNWSSPINKYMLDDSDYNIYTLAFQQLLDALAKLENHRKIQKINAELEKSAITDFLTGLYNRDGLFQKMKQLREQRAEGKDGFDVSLIYVDLDNFKYYNDTFGHDVGDMVLRNIADILKKVSKQAGFATRFGGDEFLVVLFTADRRQVRNAAEEIMESIHRAQSFVPEIEKMIKKPVVIPDNRKVSCSMGITVKEDMQDIQEFNGMIKEADDTLYFIKRSTKNDYRFSS